MYNTVHKTFVAESLNIISYVVCFHDKLTKDKMWYYIDEPIELEMWYYIDEPMLWLLNLSR